jgi:unsaturated chondroitin disaccharide hydrolase
MRTDLRGVFMISVTDAQRTLFAGALEILADKVLKDEAALGVWFPYVTAADGSWKRMLASKSAGYSGQGWDHGNWFCGFWVGLLLASYLKTKQTIYLELAHERMQLVSQRAADPNTHDIGFIFLSSALPGFRITGDRYYAELGLQAAARLRHRLVSTPVGSYVAAWGPLSDRRARASSAIDTMANLPLLFWAAEQSGDASFTLAGRAHADMTRAAFIRPDGSTYHAVEYDPDTGRKLRGYTFQGYADESCWSRGQSWAVLGFAATARATRDRLYLQTALALADYFLDRLGSSTVPPWDFDDPDGAHALRDTSAAAILARALLELGDLQSDTTQKELRYAQAIRLLDQLCTTCIAHENTHRGLLKHACYSRPHGEGTDSAVLFGDYYFVDALCRILFPQQFTGMAEHPFGS